MRRARCGQAQSLVDEVDKATAIEALEIRASVPVCSADLGHRTQDDFVSKRRAARRRGRARQAAWRRGSASGQETRDDERKEDKDLRLARHFPSLSCVQLHTALPRRMGRANRWLPSKADTTI